jgi:hypothetical protein
VGGIMVVVVTSAVMASATRISAAGVMAGRGLLPAPDMVVRASGKSATRPCVPQTSAMR